MYEDKYEVEELWTGLFAIDDAKENSMYLIVEDKKALLVNSGITTGKLKPLLQTLTGKPVELALTHAHGDHMYHSGEFETVYMHRADIAAWMPLLKLETFAGEILFGVPHKKYDIKRFTPITEDTVFDLGGISVKTILTPGSCVFVDESHKPGRDTRWIFPPKRNISFYRLPNTRTVPSLYWTTKSKIKLAACLD